MAYFDGVDGQGVIIRNEKGERLQAPKDNPDSHLRVDCKEKKAYYMLRDTKGNIWLMEEDYKSA